MKHPWFPLYVLFGLALCLCSERAARATTIIPMSDEDLAASSQAIVEGRCVEVQAAWNDAHTAIYTFVTFDVTRVHKGDLEPGRIVIKQLGGQTADAATVVWGAPYWQRNWAMLLYLDPDTDGALHVAHWSLGYFRILDNAQMGQAWVVRPDPGSNVEMLPEVGGTVTNSAPYDDYVARLDALLAAHPGTAARVPVRTVPRDYPGAAKSGGSGADFSFLGSGFRWFEPDSGGKVTFRVNPRNAPPGSDGAGEAAAEVWSTVPGSTMRVEIVGATSACGIQADGTNSIAFNDCSGMFDDPVNCTGVVALGGVASATSSQSITIAGKTFARIQDADIVFNSGFDNCLFAAHPEVVSEVMTHEMGHTLGFGHSSERIDESNTVLRDATMFFATHNDGRGAAVRQDDTDAERFLYRANGSAAAVAIVTDALPDASVGVPYTFDLRATGAAPFTWSIADGTLPSGLTLQSSGRILGTCGDEETTMVTVRVRDAANFDETRTLQVRVTRTPAPFVVSVVFKQASGKLVVKALNVDASATLAVNGTEVSPPRPVKFKAAKGQLVVSGPAADLNVRGAGPNILVVTVNGQASNAFAF